MSTFKQFQLSKEIIGAIEKLGYNEPTTVQTEVIPALLEGKNLIVKSQTGSGKTAAFAIPICERVQWEERKPQVLVLTPTRELASQIQQDIFNIGRYKRLKVEAIFGRSSYERQAYNLKQRTHVVVATPGRLIDHMTQKTIDLSMIDTVIIDESDEMLAMGFIEQIENVMKVVPPTATLALFSATMPAEIKTLATRYLKDPLLIEVKSENKVTQRIKQQYYEIPYDEKITVLEDVLTVVNPESSIVFCNTRAAVEEIAEALEALEIEVETLHGGMEQRHRTAVINDFKHGYFRYLVATDVAARGLDIADIALVVNFDLPENVESYVHRIGRTARFENDGHAISFVSSSDYRYLNPIQAMMDDRLVAIERPTQEEVLDAQAAFKATQQTKMKLKKEKGHDFKEEIMKLHINAGKKTKMRAGDVVGALCNIEGMTGADIGVISLLDVSTFVEILNSKGEMVLAALQDFPIKGRVRRVSKANETTYESDLKNEED
ncbi:DEAD/DEAH box helicase [Brochothrix campestris]|uniref:DEAD/DEAH box helicase n=1 Tax=Brochothrix campestris FSL F6-1037 TaxID=1265861 RepID=W7D4D4_9LIST|nr:DEAD/DEAH box helicase [Brochothrix campestris]EUJ40173.1 DEAD/DEAH box helicase [Brochothrix campestris FSL F6-1037]